MISTNERFLCDLGQARGDFIYITYSYRVGVCLDWGKRVLVLCNVRCLKVDLLYLKLNSIRNKSSFAVNHMNLLHTMK